MSDYFDHVERELRAAVRGQAHLPWWVRLWLRHSRALVVVLAGLIVAGPALAAAGVFQSGSPVTPVVAPTRNAGEGVAISSSATLLSLRAPDPAGGLPWGMRVLRTTRAVVCVQVGRVRSGVVGAIGRDSAFADDGRFHPFSDNYEQGPPCVTPDARGNAYLNVAEYGVPASGLFAGPRGSGCRPRRSVAGLRAGIALKGNGRLRTLASRYVGRPVCPPADLRDVFYGLLGPDAVSVTREAQNGRFVTTPTGPDGAYLFVLRNQSSANAGGFTYDAGLFPGAVRAVTYRDGHTCRLPAPNVPGGGGASCPAVGYVSPTSRLPSPAAVAAHVTARLAIAKSYCSKGQLTEPCSGRTPPGFRRLDMRSQVPQGLVVISFTSRVAVTNAQSYYYIQLCYPPPNANSHIPRWFQRLSRKTFECFFGGLGDPTDIDYKAGAHITNSELIGLRPRGVIHGDVSLVITTGPAAPAPSPATKGQSVGRDVGHFTINMP
jgi:hypothetical protein